MKLDIENFLQLDINDVNVLLDTSDNEVHMLGTYRDCCNRYKSLIRLYPYLIVVKIPNNYHSIELVIEMFSSSEVVSKILPYLVEVDTANGVDVFELDWKYINKNLEVK